MGRRRELGLALLVILWLMCGLARAADAPSGIAQADQDPLSPQQRQWLTTRYSPIRIGVTSIPPQVFRSPEDGALSGLCIDYIDEMEKVLSCRFEVVYFDTWAAMMEAAFARDIDVVYAAQKTPSREKAFLFTRPYLKFDNKIVTTQDITGPLTLDDLADKTVAVVRGTALEEYLQSHFPKIRLLSVDDELVGLMRVSFNQANAMVIEIARASWYIQQKKITNLHIAGNTGYAFRLGFACRNDWPELRDILDAGLATISPKRRSELIDLWIPPLDKGLVDPRVVIAVLAGAAMVLLAVFAWNRTLRLQVHRRTLEMKQEIEAHQKDISMLKRFEAIISLSDDLMIFVDRDFVYRAINNAHLKVVNKTYDQVIGHSVTEVVGQKLFDSYLRSRLEEALGGKIVTYERWFTIEPLGHRYLQAVYHPYENTAGVIEGVVGVLHDITERKRAEEELTDSEEKYRALIEQAVEMLFLHDLEGNLIDVNQAAIQMTGYSREQLLHMKIYDIDPDADAREDKAHIWETLPPLASKRFEVRHRRRDGSIYWAEIRAGKLLLKGKPYIMALANDITEHRKAEEEREKLLKELSHKNEELDNILFIASHDLKSPLVNIQGFASELEKSVADLKALLNDASLIAPIRQKLAVLLDTDIPESLYFIKSGSRKMDVLLSGLLRLSRVGAIDLHPTTLNVNTLISDILSSLRFMIQENNIDIAAEGTLPACCGDLTLITQVFANLVDNAIKYRQPGRPCRIRIRGRLEENRSLYQIEDNGIGIASEQKDKVFELFHRLNPCAEGEGIGLTIVRRVLDRQNGTIQIDSEIGTGTTVSVTLPCA